MIKPKKPIAFVCAAALLLSPTGALGASPSDFVDFPNDWSTGAMTAAVDNGLLGGVDGEHIAPQGVLTRAQMAAIINRAFGAEKTASLTGYTDVAANAWYATDMAKAVQMGTFSGTGNGLLEPDRAITREEAFSVLARAFALEAGDDSSLASFSDGAQVSSWAKGSVSAMVAGGYVNGSDGNRLNPQQSITRAEFAAVMSNLVAQYIDADSTLNRSLEIDGNVIVRGNVDLSGYTINGDVIIADEATNVTLDGVTVNGRLVVRGASDSLTINDSSADGVIITNPNGASVLKTDNASDLGTVTALGDLTLSGGQLDRLTIAESATITVEKDASVETITVSADDVTINGAGKVDKVQANADNVHVNVEDAEVTAGKGTSGVTAGDTSVAPGESATVSGDSDNDNENTGSNTGNGGSSGGNNNNPGGGNDNPGTTPGGGESTGDNTNPGGSEETPAAAIINAETTKLVDLGWSQYVTVQFTKGHTLKNTSLTIDGTDVTSAFTPVTDDGSIVKWEITDLNPAQLVATSDGESQSDTLSNNANPAKPEVVQAEDSAPEFMLAHGSLSYWDFYLTNYDDKGQPRVDPIKTTFNLSGKVASDVPAFYSADAELTEGATPGQISGQVVIEFAQDSDADKDWFAAVPENTANTVQLVAYNDNKNVLNDNLSYTKKDDGTITIALGQTNFMSNGRYYVRVNSTNHDSALVPIHVVNAVAPTLQLDGDGRYSSGENAHFKILNMTYGITNPTYAAELTRPDGKTVELEMSRDWYQIGDSFILYNDVDAENGRNNIPYNGQYTLTVHSNGFKDMSITFTVKNGEAAPEQATARSARSMNVDAVSRATSVGGGDSSSGGGAISANLKYDADLLTNAFLLDELGLANEAAAGIVNRWSTEMSGYDSVWDHEGNAYKWNEYLTAVNNERNRGEYLSFAEFADGAGYDLSGTPNAIKSVLEDNLLGDVQYNGTWVGLQTPEVTLVNSDGDAITAVEQDDDIILKTKDTTYFDKLESVNINNWQLDLPEIYYKVEGDTLTIYKDALGIENPGQNTITLYADGYRAKHLSVYYTREIETGLSISGPGNIERGDQVRMKITGSKGDFVNNITTVTVHKPNGATSVIYPYSVGSYDDDYYSTSDTNVVTIVDDDGSVFEEDGTYTITIDAQYYNRLTTEPFTVTGKLKSAPTATSAEKNSDNNYVVHFDESATSHWKNAITSITVNDKAYTKKDIITDLGKNQYQWDNIRGTFDLTLQGHSFTQDENTIVIKATGYNDTTIKVTSGGSLVGAPEEPGDEAKPAPAAPTATVDEAGNVTLAFADTVEWEYCNAVTEVTVNDTAYSKFDDITGNPGEKQYEWQESQSQGIDALYLDNTSFVTGGNTVLIKAEGYKDLTVTVKIDGASEAIKEVPTVLSFGLSSGTLYFDQSGSNDAASPYLADINNVTVNGEEYTEDTGENWYLEENTYKITDNGSDRNIKFYTGSFDWRGDNTIVITADGYKTLTVTVHSDGTYTTSTSDPATEGEKQPVAGIDAPQPLSASKDSYNDVTIKFTDSNLTSEIEVFANKINAVAVNNGSSEISYSVEEGYGIFGLSDNSYKIALDGSDFSIKLADNGFNTSGNSIVTLKAEGYKDLTITIDKDGYIVK